MKRVIRLLFVCLMLAGSLSMMAVPQASRKKSSSATSASVPLKKLSDGYYDVNGHTYTSTFQGVKMTIKFMDYDIAEISVTSGGRTEKNRVHYTYWGYGLYGVYPEFDTDPNTLRLEVSDDGKKLFAREDIPDDDPLTFTLVK